MAELDTDSDSSHPEIISLSSSASIAREHHRVQRTFHAAEKRKAKEKNRRRDERFKAQAADTRQRTTVTREIHQVRDHKMEPDNIPSVDQRMTGDAEEDIERDASGSETGEEWGGINIENEDKFPIVVEEFEDVEMLKGEESGKETRNEDFDSGRAESDDDDQNTLQSISSKYLPDHIFLTALSKSKAGNDVRPSQATPKTRPARKRQGVRARAKDVAVGWVPISHPNTVFLFFCIL
jgi:hypothetical protein